MDIWPSMLAKKYQIYQKPMEQDVPLLTKALPTGIYLEHILCCRTYHGCDDVLGEIINRLVNVSCHGYLDRPPFSEVHVHAHMRVIIYSFNCHGDIDRLK